jgi:hypothetical protein
MSYAWKRFLFVRLPIAVLGLALLAQMFAWSLSGVTMRRNRTDELALTVLSDPTNYRVLLLGDSITRNATARFALGAPGQVGNLATHANFGLPGEILLLERYLRTHASPQYVVLAFAPVMYRRISDIRLVRYTLWHTFRGVGEQEFLRSQYPGIESRDWLPAAADVQVRIVEPLFSSLKSHYLKLRQRGPGHIGSGSDEPNPNGPADVSRPMPAAVERALAEGLRNADAPINAPSLRRLCQLSQDHGFRIKLALPPMPSELESALVGRGALTQLHQELNTIMSTSCPVDEIFDFNRVRTYPASSFHLDLIHLFGDGWEQRYASDLRRYLNELADRSSSSEASGAPEATRAR